MDYSIFSLVHEVAVLGTAAVVLALTTLWYSPLLFGRAWITLAKHHHVLFDETSRSYVPQLAAAFVGQLILTSVVALALPFGAVLAVSVWYIAGLIFAVAAAGMALPMIYEGKGWRYVVLHVAFLGISVVVNVLSLTYWPW